MKNKAKADGKHFVYLATAISALGGMLFGYDIGVISGAILFIKKDFSLSPGLEEIVVSSVLLGSLVGAVVGGVLADRLGRRRLLIITAVVFGLGAVGAALAPGTTWLIVARVVAGTAIGVASFVAPLYISEIAPVDIRGKLVSVNQVALTSGIVISYLIDYAFAGSQAWRGQYGPGWVGGKMSRVTVKKTVCRLNPKPRLLSRSGCLSTTGDGRMCLSTFVVESASPDRPRRLRSSFVECHISRFRPSPLWIGSRPDW